MGAISFDELYGSQPVVQSPDGEVLIAAERLRYLCGLEERIERVGWARFAELEVPAGVQQSTPARDEFIKAQDQIIERMEAELRMLRSLMRNHVGAAKEAK